MEEKRLLHPVSSSPLWAQKSPPPPRNMYKGFALGPKKADFSVKSRVSEEWTTYVPALDTRKGHHRCLGFERPTPHPTEPGGRKSKRGIGGLGGSVTDEGVGAGLHEGCEGRLHPRRDLEPQPRRVAVWWERPDGMRLWGKRRRNQNAYGTGP